MSVSVDSARRRSSLLSHLLDDERVRTRSLGADTPAIMDGVRSLTWSEYVEQVAKASGALVAAGVRPGDRVAIRLAKSIESFVMTHAVLRAGAVMVPVDPSAPDQLAAGVLADSAAAALVTDASDATISNVTDGSALRCTVVLGRDDVAPLNPSTNLLTRRDLSAAQPGELVEVGATAPAYIIYTSGSTGRPKGIVHSHESALTYATTAAELYGLTPRDRLANIAALHFDQSTFELYSAPLAGSSVVVVPDPVLRFPASLTALLASQQVTVVYSVPSLFRQIADRGALDDRDLTQLRWVLFGGESYPPKQLATLMNLLPETRFSNVYGPAEVNQCMVHHVASAPIADEAVPIGAAWPAATVAVVDADDVTKLAEAGTAGVLIVRTPTMMTGYWNRPDLTAASVLERPDGQGGSQRWYVTGDLVVEREDGELEFLGRLDNQVKVRGHRIELEAVDDALGDVDGVRSAVAVVRRVASGEDTVVALVVPTRPEDDWGGEPHGFANGVIAELRRRLPHAAVPAEVVLVDDLPRTGTGKIDRRAAQRLLDSPRDAVRARMGNP